MSIGICPKCETAIDINDEVIECTACGSVMRVSALNPFTLEIIEEGQSDTSCTEEKAIQTRKEIPQETPGIEKPTEVRTAIKLLYISLGIGIVSSILSFPRAGSTFSALFILVFTDALLIFIIIQISKGRNWARITFLVLCLLGLPLTVLILLQEFMTDSVMAGIIVIQTTLQFIVVLLLFRKDSTRWFMAKKNLDNDIILLGIEKRGKT
jgi:hypothetical protein